MSLAEDIEEILEANRKRADQIKALVEYIEQETKGVGYRETGIPGAVCSSTEVAPGVTLHHNGNGSVVAVEVEL